jgi:type VI secretion system secreted protein VgrG
VCLSAEQIRPEEQGLSTYSLRIAPRLALLSERTNYRIFQQQTVVQIVTAVLDDWQIEHRWQVDDAAYPQLEYRVQYGESDLAFISRLLERAGISYHFADSEGATRLVLDDAPQHRDGRALPLPYAASPELADQEHAGNVRVCHRHRGGRYRIRDYDFRHASRFELAQQASAGDGAEQLLEDYRYQPGAFTTEGHEGGDTPAADDRGVARSDERHGARLAHLGLEHERSGQRQVSFSHTALDLHAGMTFAISGHPRRELAVTERLLITDMALEGTTEGGWRAVGRARFAAAAYRPPMTTRLPRIHGLESAIVVGPENEEIYTDELGRVRVQFHWDRRGGYDERSSCWLRVSHGWAGGGFGMIALPRIGQEVLVSFLGGDPDQPVVVGRVYNGESRVPYELPGRRTVSTWRSRSTPRSDGFNELRFEDRAGEEEVFLHAERDLAEEVGHDHRLRVERNETIRIGAHRSETVGSGDKLVVRRGDKEIEVATGDMTVSVAEGFLLLRNAATRIRLEEGVIVIDTGQGASIKLARDEISFFAKKLLVEVSDQIKMTAEARIDLRGGLITLND